MPALLKTTQIQEPSSASINLTLDTSGNGTFAGTAVMSSPYTMRNKIINGAMVIDQRNAGASVAISPVAVQYTLDRWSVYEDTGGAVSVQRVADAPSGFVNSAKVTVTSASGALSATQRTIFYQQIEGYNVADLAFGSASAQTITISFRVKSSVTGQFGGVVSNAGTRSYPFSYTISSANTWETKTVTITGDTTGTWATGNTTGLAMVFALGVGSSYAGTAGAWVAGDINSTTGSTNLLATLNATWQLTGVQLEIGTVATPFEYRNFQQELAMCQRYFSKSYNIDVAVGTATSVGATSGYAPTTQANRPILQVYFPVSMRATPTVTAYSSNNGASGNFYNSDGAANFAVSSTNTGMSGTCIYPNGSLTVGVFILGHWTASIEL